MFFLDAPGGTGKTFLIKLILAEIRSQNHIALALTSSGKLLHYTKWNNYSFRFEITVRWIPIQRTL